jgi:hypothetical protein
MRKTVSGMREPGLTIKQLDMKRVKIILNSIAITIAIAGAFATRFCMQDNTSQYIPVNDTFKPVGDFGIDYNCYDSQSTCTYYQPDSVVHPEKYLPYQKGQFMPANELPCQE